MADMFEKDSAGFTEDYDPNAEPGETAERGSGDTAEGSSDEPAGTEESSAGDGEAASA
jgi:large subunit ribosomal protein L9